MAVAVLLPSLGVCSVESSLSAIHSRLVTTILPLLSVLGMCFAALSFVAGSPNARTHLLLAMIGTAIGFGAESIMNFIRGVVN